MRIALVLRKKQLFKSRQMQMNATQTKEKESADIELLEVISNTSELLLFNDDVNTFDHVIDCLIRICKHEPEQAEQCAMIVHFKGKCTVKKGDKGELIAMCRALCDEGLSATIGE
jgi:ATP-dependent Clp protease adaptor protein ClpS